MQDLEFLIEKAVDTSKADYAVFTGVQVGLRGSAHQLAACLTVLLRGMGCTQEMTRQAWWFLCSVGKVLQMLELVLHAARPCCRSTTGQQT